MGERNIKGTWKGQRRRVSKKSSPLIGMVYKGVGKFFGETVTGVLIEMFDQNDEAVLRTKENKLVSVDKKTLEIVVSE